MAAAAASGPVYDDLFAWWEVIFEKLPWIKMVEKFQKLFANFHGELNKFQSAGWNAQRILKYDKLSSFTLRIVGQKRNPFVSSIFPSILFRASAGGGCAIENQLTKMAPKTTWSFLI